MLQCDDGLHAVRPAAEDDPAVVLDFLFVKPAFFRLDARPFNRETVGIQLRIRQKPDIFLIYAIETELMMNISEGRKEASLAALRKLLLTSRPQYGMTVDLWPQESASAIMRSLIRFSAKRSGLSATVIDGISLDYAQKMRRNAGDHRVEARLYADMISDLCKEIRSMKENGYASLTRRALHVIRTCYAEPLSIADLAQSPQVSESTLARSLRSDTGQTFTQLLKAERMHAAARLLLATSDPVQAIAGQVGILDQNYFVKVFRSIYQVTPSEYRSQAISGVSDSKP